MSKTLDLLHLAQKQRVQGGGVAFIKNETSLTKEEEVQGHAHTETVSHYGVSLWFWVIGGIFLVSILALNIKIFSLIRDYPDEREYTFLRLNRVERLSNSNGRQVVTLTREAKDAREGIEAVNLKAQGTAASVARLGKELSLQAKLIKKLRQENIRLSDKTRLLEAKVGKLSSANLQTIEAQ